MEWDKNLNCIAAACRSESTGFSANMLLLGREVREVSQTLYFRTLNVKKKYVWEHMQKNYRLTWQEHIPG